MSINGIDWGSPTGSWSPPTEQAMVKVTLSQGGNEIGSVLVPGGVSAEYAVMHNGKVLTTISVGSPPGRDDMGRKVKPEAVLLIEGPSTTLSTFRVREH